MTTIPATPSTLGLAVLPRRGILWDALLVSLGVGLISGAAQISFHIPGTPVPVSGQTFAVLLVGTSLGAVRGGSSALLYFALGLVAPVYAHGTHGWSVVTGTTGGYLIGFVLAGALTGWLAEHGWDRKVSSSIGAMLTGNVVIYAVGLPWLAVVLHANVDDTLKWGLYPFVPGDTIKLYLAALALPAAWKLVGKRRG